MKRWLVAAGLIAVAAVAAFAALPLLVSSDVARDQIAGLLSRSLGASVRVAGEPELVLFPRVRVVLPNVHAANDKLGFTADIDSVEAELDLTELLQGVIEPKRFLLIAPLVHATAQTFDRIAQADGDNGFVNTLAPQAITIRQGTLVVAQADGKRQRLSGIDMQLAWPGANGAASLSSQFKWRGEDVEVRARLSDTAALGNEGKGSLNLAVASSILRINFEGALSGLSNLQADGTLTVAVPNMRRALGWIGRDVGNGATLGAFALDGTARINARGLVLSQVGLELDGNAAEGALAVTWHKPRPSLKGALATEKFDLTGYLGTFTADGEGQNSGTALLPTAALSSIDMDLQVSARQVRIGETRVSQAALSMLVQDGNLALEVGEAQVYGGNVTARLSGTAAPAPGNENISAVSLQLETKAQNINLGALPLAEREVRPVEGAADLTFTARGSGTSLAELASSMNGTLELEAKAVVLNGLDLAHVIDTFVGGDPAKNTGVTTFDSATIAGTIEDGILAFSKATAEGSATRVRAAGRASFIDLTVALTGSATHREGEAEKTTSLPFLVRGPLSAPQFLPDLNRLIEGSRSGLAN